MDEVRYEEKEYHGQLLTDQHHNLYEGLSERRGLKAISKSVLHLYDSRVLQHL